MVRWSYPVAATREGRSVPEFLRTSLFPWPLLGRAIFAPLLKSETVHIARAMLGLTFAVVVVWWATVPIHELLHVAGCVLTGGAVSELTVQPIYGGTLLARWLDFVKPGGDYAGQLSGFDTGGSDVTYFVTVAFPFLLTIFFGVSMLEFAARRSNPLWHAIGVVHTVLPIASIGGDYYEMGSIVFTRLIGKSTGPEADLLRGDDLVRVFTGVQEAGLQNGIVMVGAGLLIGIIVVHVTYVLSIGFARIMVRGPSPPS
jgi:hypothetical protein